MLWAAYKQTQAGTPTVAQSPSASAAALACGTAPRPCPKHLACGIQGLPDDASPNDSLPATAALPGAQSSSSPHLQNRAFSALTNFDAQCIYFSTRACLFFNLLRRRVLGREPGVVLHPQGFLQNTCSIQNKHGLKAQYSVPFTPTLLLKLLCTELRIHAATWQRLLYVCGRVLDGEGARGRGVYEAIQR